jgi:propanol-preferring alcohol dehydrogenase
MKAWQFDPQSHTFAPTEVPAPTAGPGQVVIEVQAAGLCHSDVTVLDDPGQLQTLGGQRRTIGHEIAGTIIELGEGVSGWTVGDRVGICPTAGMQLGGPDPSVAEAGLPGYTRDGGFGERCIAWPGELVRVPDELDITLGAVATDAGMTAYHAIVTRGGLQAGMKVGVIGFGGLGQIGARVAVLKGAEVHVAERKRDVWPLAESFGVTHLVEDVSEWAGQDFDLIVDYAGFGTTTAGALKAIRFNGTVVQVGLGRTEIEINTLDMITHRANYLGSIGGTRADIEDLYGMMARGELLPHVTEIGFDQIGDGIQQLREGTVTGRLAVRY